ncbi:MAG: family permease, partial [Chloroflexi bacterium]|nr:family permease [Chloroflexota bacterium]
ETQNPRRSIPIALFSAVGIIGLFYVVSSYTAAIGFGQSHTAALVGDSTPWTTLSNRYWGSNVSWILSLTVLNSIFANLVSGCNATIRVVFSMGREGIFPRVLGRTTASGVPLVALSAYMAFSIILSLVGGALWGPFGAYGFYGTILGLGIVVVYILVNLALIMFYWRDYRAEFNFVRHGILPIIASLLMLLPIYGLIWPVPSYPNNLVPYLMVAWVILGFGYLSYLFKQRPEIVDAMGRAMGEAPPAVVAAEPSLA